MTTARVFKSGNSQAVRLPKQFRFVVGEVEIFRRGSEVVLREPKRNLRGIVTTLGSLPKDFMKSRRADARPQKRRGL